MKGINVVLDTDERFIKSYAVPAYKSKVETIDQGYNDGSNKENQCGTRKHRKLPYLKGHFVVIH